MKAGPLTVVPDGLFPWKSLRTITASPRRGVKEESRFTTSFFSGMIYGG